MTMNEFFSTKKITVEIEGQSPVTLIMYPLRMRQLPEFLDLLGAGMEPAYTQEIINIIQDAVHMTDSEFESLPAAALETLVNIFIELSFPPEGRVKLKGRDAKSCISANEYPVMLDFLISQGHIYSEIMEYTVPQFRAFVDAAVERLTGTKTEKKDPIAVLTSLGIPIKRE